MVCCRCQNDLSECTCPDLQERLARLTDGGNLAVKWCRACNLSYHKCQCQKPDFVVRFTPKEA